jgi:hypothetical protein
VSVPGHGPDADELGVGDRAQSVVDGRLCTLVTEGAGAHEYLVRFDDGTEAWLCDYELRAIAPPVVA